MPQPALWAGVARRSGFGHWLQCAVLSGLSGLLPLPFCPIQENTDNAIWGRTLRSCTEEERERWIPGP